MEFSSQEYWKPCPAPGDLPTQELNPCLLHCRQILYHLSHTAQTKGCGWMGEGGCSCCSFALATLFPGQQHFWNMDPMESTHLWVDYPFPTFSSQLCSLMSDTPSHFKYHLQSVIMFSQLPPVSKQPLSPITSNVIYYLCSRSFQICGIIC